MNEQKPVKPKRSRFRFELYVRDWLTGTRHLSLEARGLYIDLLAMMNERRDRRLPNDPTELTPKLGLRDRRTWQRVLGELVSRGKLDVSDGWITNRRIRLDQEDEDDTNRPTDGRQMADSQTTDGQQSADRWPIQASQNEQNQDDIQQACPGTKNLEPRTKSIEIESEFANWYQGYPKKVGRGQALKAYRAARKLATAEAIQAGMAKYRATLNGTEMRFVKHPATWLNGQCWLDEPTPHDEITPERREEIKAAARKFDERMATES